MVRPVPRGSPRSGTKVAIAVAVVAALLAGLAATRLLTRAPAEPDAAFMLERTIRRTTDRDGLSYQVDLRVEGGLAARELTVAGATAVTTAAAQGTVEVHGTTSTVVEFLLQGRRLFLQPEGVPATWAEVDLLDALSDTDDDEVGVLGLALQRPAELLAMLRGVQQARWLGQETIDGIQTDHFRGTVSFEAALARPTPESDQALVRKVTERLDGDELWVDAWIDANGKLRLLQLSGTLDGGTGYELGMRFLSFGDTVEVEAPDAVAVEPLDLPVVLGLKLTD